jgi:hypothetical protein
MIASDLTGACYLRLASTLLPIPLTILTAIRGRTVRIFRHDLLRGLYERSHAGSLLRQTAGRYRDGQRAQREIDGQHVKAGHLVLSPASR